MFDIEFNPKESFLKEQLEVSGLEMKFFGIGAGAENRRRVQEENKEQRKLNKQARANYSYEKDVLKAEKKDYFAQREFQFETAKKQYNYNKDIQDYSYGQSLARYEKDLGIYEAQLGYNEDAFGLAIGDQQAALQDFGLEQAFQRESIYADLQNELINQGFNKESQEVRLEEINTSFQNELINQGFNKQSQEVRLEEIKTGFQNQLTDLGLDKLQQQASLFGIQSSQRIGTERIQTELKNLSNANSFEKEAEFVRGLQAAGQASLGQAGKSTAKSIGSAQAESFRTLTQLKSSLKGSRRSAGVQLLNLNVDSAVRETGVNLSINKLDEAARFARVRSGLQTKQVDIDIARIDEAARFAGVRSGLQTKQVGIDIARIDQAINFANEEAEFNDRVLKANMDSQIAQIERNIQQIELQKLGQDLQAKAQMSIFPEPLPELPEPQLGPKRTFVTPVKQDAPTVPRGPRRNATAEIIGGVAQVASFALGPAGGAVNAGLLGGAGGTLFGTGAAVAGNLTSNLNAIGAGIGALAPQS